MRSKLMTVVIMLLLASCVSLRADDGTKPIQDAAKAKSIRTLLELTGTNKLALQVMDQMITGFKKVDQSIPDEFWNNFRKSIKPDELTDQIIPIYAKHFTREDIDGLIAFYQSPLGKKVITALPEITQESMAVGQAWGRKKAEEVVRELQKRQGSGNQGQGGGQK